MWIIIVVAALVSVLGFILAGIGLILLSRSNLPWVGAAKQVSLKEDPAPIGWPGPALILAAGALMALGADYKIVSIMYSSASTAEENAVEAERRLNARVDNNARVQAALQDPLELLWVQCTGPEHSDPFTTQEWVETTSLRLRVRSKIGSQWISDVAGARLVVPGLALGEDTTYHPLPWQAVLAGIKDPQQRAVAARLRTIKDLRRFDEIEVALVIRAPEGSPKPESLSIYAGHDGSVPLFTGSLAEVSSTDAVGRLLIPSPVNIFQTLPNLAATYADCWWGEVPPQPLPFWAPESVGGLVGSLATDPLSTLVLVHALPQETNAVTLYRDDQSVPTRSAAFGGEEPPAVDASLQGGLGKPFGISLLLGVALLIAGVSLVRKRVG